MGVWTGGVAGGFWEAGVWAGGVCTAGGFCDAGFWSWEGASGVTAAGGMADSAACWAREGSALNARSPATQIEIMPFRKIFTNASNMDSNASDGSAGSPWLQITVQNGPCRAESSIVPKRAGSREAKLSKTARGCSGESTGVARLCRTKRWY